MTNPNPKLPASAISFYLAHALGRGKLFGQCVIALISLILIIASLIIALIGIAAVVSLFVIPTITTLWAGISMNLQLWEMAIWWLMTFFLASIPLGIIIWGAVDLLTDFALADWSNWLIERMPGEEEKSPPVWCKVLWVLLEVCLIVPPVVSFCNHRTISSSTLKPHGKHCTP